MLADFRLLARRSKALPLVPVDRVDDVWVDALDAAPQGEVVVRYCDYVTTSWVEGPYEKPMWNHFGNTGHRTNNNIEGWHHKLNSMTSCHPNIFDFIKLIKCEQSGTEVKMAQLRSHPRAPARKRRYVEVDQRLTRERDRLRNGDITALQYTDCVSHILGVW